MVITVKRKTGNNESRNFSITTKDRNILKAKNKKKTLEKKCKNT